MMMILMIFLFYFLLVMTINMTGHASTTGIPTLDYFVSYKPFEAANAQEYYSEKLVGCEYLLFILGFFHK